MKPIRQSGWKFRVKGEFAHFFTVCRRDPCQSCERFNAHAYCDERIVTPLDALPALSRSKPPHRACPSCSEIVDERTAYSHAPWRMRAAMKPTLRPRWLGRNNPR